MMTAQDETRKVVEGFFAAWTRNNEREARALMADDLYYSGPLNRATPPSRLLG